MTWQFEVGVDFWTTGGAGRVSRVMVSPEVESSFSNFLNSNKIQHKLAISDVESSLQADKAARLLARSKRSVLKADNAPSFEQYLEFGEMLTFTRQLAEDYPNLVKRDVIGYSIEGREIFGMRVSSGADFGKKPIIFIDSGVHAREWVGPQSTLYLLNQLVTNESVSRELLDKVDWVFVPNVNPDGYVHSFNEDRLWRKNRRFVNESCTGIDLNRNFGYVWQYRPNSVSFFKQKSVIVLTIIFKNFTELSVQPWDIQELTPFLNLKLSHSLLTWKASSII
jgi:Zinc carboxypeptidase/Carboxypeptidase activation peptide